MVLILAVSSKRDSDNDFVWSSNLCGKEKKNIRELNQQKEKTFIILNKKKKKKSIL